MTTPHKAMLIQTRDALLSVCGGRCNAEYNPCKYKEVADALTAAIDAPEPEPVAWIVEFENGEQELHWNDTKESLGESQMEPYLGPPAVRLPCQQSA